jgi:alpha-galactosidase
MRPTCFYILLAFVSLSCSRKETVIEHGNLVLQFNELLQTQVSTKDPKANALMKDFSSSEYLVGKDFEAKEFQLKEATSNSYADSVGKGTQWILKGTFKQEAIELEKVIIITLYDQFPGEAFFDVSYINHSASEVAAVQWVNHHYSILPHQDTIPFWSFQGESTGARKDWVLPLKAGFSQRNYMGMNNSDYGGGIPVTDLWRPDQGIAIGHAELKPKLVSLPVSVDSVSNISIVYDLPANYKIASGDTLKTIQTFVHVHNGDYYTPLKRYGEVLRAKGLTFATPEPEAFEANWCAWGYMRDVTLEEIRGTIPKIKELGIKWVTIDDGFQQAEGDWHVNNGKFPKGDAQMKALVDEFHAQGLKVMLWWAPLAADPGSKLLAANPDMKLLNAEGKPQDITWWDAYYLSPLDDKTQQHTREVLDLFLKQWGVDGLKMDGQHLNAAPPDYASGHELSTPEAAYEGVPQFFKMIYEEANHLKPHTVIQNCPCGTCMSVFNMPYMNQAVASDPLSSWQIRLKGKTYKALLNKGAYFGDHVELSDGRTDFASSFGIGAVLGTKFTWPKENPSVKENNLLTREKELSWKHWLNLYRDKMLSTEEYRGDLYDLGYDFPETHVIQKGDTLHYAFYAPSWDGSIELRGLEAERYKVRDYVNNVDLGEIMRENPKMNFKFQKNLLIEVFPVK